MITKIELNLHLNEEHLATLRNHYEVCNKTSGIYESFEDFLYECMDFRALHHILNSAEMLADWSRHFEHQEQT